MNPGLLAESSPFSLHTLIVIPVTAVNFGEKNVGTIDRGVRLIAGIALLGALALNMVAAPLSYLAAFFGIMWLVTGAIGTCPAYTVLGISTLGKQ